MRDVIPLASFGCKIAKPPVAALVLLRDVKESDQGNMPRSIDVAEYILKRSGAISAMKLQKLVYYCQAWSLAWDGRPLFDDEIEAWANGPVAPLLYGAHRGESLVHSVGGNPEEFAADAAAQETIASVLQFYGDKSSQWLSDLTHAERPWKDARGDLPPGAASTHTISRDAMAAYYSKL